MPCGFGQRGHHPLLGYATDHVRNCSPLQHKVTWPNLSHIPLQSKQSQCLCTEINHNLWNGPLFHSSVWAIIPEEKIVTGNFWRICFLMNHMINFRAAWIWSVSICFLSGGLSMVGPLHLMMHRTFFHAALWVSGPSSAWLREAGVRHTNSLCFSKDTPRTCGRSGNKVLSDSVLHPHKHSLSIQIALDERYIKAYFWLLLLEVVLNLLGKCKQWDMIQVSKSPSSYFLSSSLILVEFTGKPFLEVMPSIPISRFWLLNTFLLFSNNKQYLFQH